MDMWKLAKPYYEKGRPMDIDHIEWMMKDAMFVCKEEKLDDSLLLPLVILHDVGYGVGKHVYLEKESKKDHMVAGAKIAEGILNKLKYPKDKAKKIVDYISVHDNWIYGEDEIYRKDLVLGTFNDLDFMWLAVPKGFVAIKKILNKTDKELIDHIKNDSKLVRRPFATKTTKKLYEKYMRNLK